ncbi:MAG: carbohydrate ABC transporter permease [Anaerolineaceae bacterium]|nr:carbohydrate ABC transporter permease [Anaerolineaceae bacterium]
MDKKSVYPSSQVSPYRRAIHRIIGMRRFGESSPLLTAISYVVLVVAVLVSILPFFYIITTAIKQSKFLFEYPPQWIPQTIYWGNFLHLLQKTPFLRWTFNTLFVSLTVTALKLFFDTLAGYAFAKMQFPGKEILFVLVIATLMVPFAAIMIPLYFMIRDMGIINSYWALILPPLANPIGIFLMRSFIESLPNDLENAARLDGTSEFNIYWTIVMPLVKPALVVLGVLTFNLQYTSFLWPLVANTSPDMQVMTTGIATQRGITVIDYGVFSAGAVMAMVPIVIFFLVLQKQWIASSLAGALKQ